MGISLTEENQYKVFLDIPATNDTSTVNIVSDTGDTINEIIDHISMNMETQVDLHLKIVIVDKILPVTAWKTSFPHLIVPETSPPKRYLPSVIKGWINSSQIWQIGTQRQYHI